MFQLIQCLPNETVEKVKINKGELNLKELEKIISWPDISH